MRFIIFLLLTLPAFAQTPFDRNVGAFVNKNCAMCHNEQLKTAGLALTKYHDTAAMIRDRDVWEKAVARIKAGEMPPKGMPRPSAEEISNTTNWIEDQFAQVDSTAPPNPGHLTAHRLNRTEYNNTIRDLLSLHFEPAADFPADDSGFGFDNIGDALSVSPVLAEKYLMAAKKIAAAAIPVALVPPKPTQFKYSPERAPMEERPELQHTFDLPAEGEYDVRAAVGGRREPFTLTVELDGKELKAENLTVVNDKPRAVEMRVRIPYGEHVLRAFLTHRDATPDEIKTMAQNEQTEQQSLAKQIAKNPSDEKQIRLQHTLGNPPTFAETVELRGPFNAVAPPLPASYARIFICGHPLGRHTPQCMRSDLAHFARLAYRRPVTDAEITKINRLLLSVRKAGLSQEQAMRVGMEAILVSPNFIYRIERDPTPGAHPVDEFELASRLSYFLWSSTPDETLLDLADGKQLAKPEVLRSQVKRMLQDPKSVALVDNFAGQWLELRNLDSIHPDPDMFPEFDTQLRKAMYTETHMFVSSLIQEDRSILDFIDGKYTFLNERLAKFYGIPGVTGSNFRRVELDGTERSGVLTQASVLTVTSYPTRTSPVLRGKWILENVLNTPPPPPPPGVGSIDAKGGPLSGTMRQQMEKHRANPMCAQCHTRMDPLGFALENYNAIGQWRTQDASQNIDASGVLPNGKKFQGSAELKTILASNRNAFAECLTEKLMIYALGRGLEGFDRTATRKIVTRLGQEDYRFSALISGIVESVPFQMGRADSSSPGATTTE